MSAGPAGITVDARHRSSPQLAASAVVIGAGFKIVGDSHGPVRIGSDVQILENTVLQLLPDNDLVIEDGVTVGRHLDRRVAGSRSRAAVRTSGRPELGAAV